MQAAARLSLEISAPYNNRATKCGQLKSSSRKTTPTISIYPLMENKDAVAYFLN